MNEAIVKMLPKMNKFEAFINDVKKDNFPITISGLGLSPKVHFAYATKFYAERPILIVAYNEIELNKIVNDLKFFEDDEILVFPKREIVYYDIDTMNKDATMDRLNVYTKLYNQEAKVIVTTIEALMQKTIDKNTFFSKVCALEVGKNIPLDSLKENLINIGYERADMVERRGEFAVRGGIIDVFPLALKNPIRIEFWGDEIDSIRVFDVESQRTIDSIREITIFPSEEFLIDKEKLEIIGDEILNKYPSAIADVETIKNGNYLTKVDKYFQFFYNKTSTLLDYISKNTIVFLDEPNRIISKAESIRYELSEITKEFIEKNNITPGFLSLYETPIDINAMLEAKNIINLEGIDTNMHAKRNEYSFSCREVNFFRGAMDIFIQEVEETVEKGDKLLVLGGTVSKSRNLATMLLDHKINATFLEKLDESFLINGRVLIIPGSLSEGFCYPELSLTVAAGEFGTVKDRRPTYKTAAFKEGKKVVFADLNVGDYVVHNVHGIAQYMGIKTLVVDNKKTDYIMLKYKDDDTLYIKTNQLDSIRKYMSSSDNPPRLNKMGSKEFTNTKARVKASLKDIAKGLIALYAKRKEAKGYAFSKDTVWQSEFEEAFPYEETADQLRCIEEVKQDMEKQIPMDRLLCGDVGYGKTEVAIRAAFKAVMDGKQVAYLAPTTVLAEQQYKTFKERMQDYPISIYGMSRFRTAKEKNDVIQKIKNGDADIIIGTHSLLRKDISFKDLGLLIIDEEHRFGVAQKEKIKELKNNVDVLTMTATPIPRTMHMSIVGIRDMSVIYEPPQNRRPVQTYVLEYDEEVIREAIIKEVERKGQVFYLFNRVEGIEKKAQEISKLVPEAKVAYAHGQMTSKELENIMNDFISGTIDVIICTTIMESGIDIPNANTIIIEDADRLGLAQLYQIRGRVGRSDKLAYAYITYRRNKILSEVSEKRLKAIKEFTEFGSGFKIALRDLEIRGAGNILGPEQHGHMEAVGYEMYCKLLEESVKELNGIVEEETVDTQIDLKITAFIPDSYIENQNQKIEVYQDIANLNKEEQISEIIDELIDRFGTLPAEVVNLIEVARIKILARNLNIISISQNGNSVVIKFNSQDDMPSHAVQFLIDNFKNRIFFSSGIQPYITLKLQNQIDSDILEEVYKLLSIMKG